MDFLDILITSRMPIFWRIYPKTQGLLKYSRYGDSKFANLGNSREKKLEPGKTATPHSCDTTAPLRWTCSRPSQALVQRSHTPAVEFALPSQPCRTKPHHKRFPVWHQEVRGRARRKEGSKRGGERSRGTSTSFHRQAARASPRGRASAAAA